MPITHIDTALFSWLYNIGHRLNADWLFAFFSSYLLYLLVIGFVALLVVEKDVRRRWYLVTVAVLSQIVARGIFTEAFYYIFYRPRPFEHLGIESLFFHSATAAFPSGHTVFLFTLALVVFLMNKRWGWVYAVAAVATGIARVIAGVHWPSDIIGGVVVAAAGFAVVYFLLLPQKLYKRLTAGKEESHS